ncbi:MAG: hypothetical protein EAX90_07055 [Candidatus Heimdallarchaeota archaeon]|nr:hypothetical protein [Candidatus Heimdallarchaeota archaeon]
MSDVINWLVNSEPYIEYNTRVDLLDQLKIDNKVIIAKEKLLKDSRIENFLQELKEWPGYPLKRHNDAAHLIHKLSFLADIGIGKENSVIQQVSQKIFTQQSDEGAFQLIINIPTHFGGSGEDEHLWMLCDAPLILYSLIKVGWGEEQRVQAALKHIASLVKENGWPCAASSKLEGKFRGPGRKNDPCPYANLVSLKALSEHPKWRNSKECKIGAEILLDLWDQRKERKAYLFGMGTDFKKLKAPLIWYDILHVTEVLTQFDWLKKDERLQQMIEIIRSKVDENGFYTAESIWRVWKDWEFGQKKEPSAWITFLVYRILKRM